MTGTALTNLFSNDLVAKVEYPDKTTGAASSSASNDVGYTYDLQGDVSSKTDQNQTTHTYTYDVLGRPTLDAVTTLGTGVDGSILALGYNYTALGLPYQQTSYSDAAGTSVVNQVQDVYTGYGQLTTQYQEHAGAVDPLSSLAVQYGYSQPTGANYSRLSSMTYPNGRVLDYVYSSGLDSDISRVSGLSDDSGTGAGSVESYTYLGLGTIVQRADGNGIELTYIKQSGESNGDAGDQYIGLDRFGRVADQRWIPVSSPTNPTDRFQYGYDRDGNVLYKNNLVKSAFSELYHANSAATGDNNAAYDNLNRLTGFRRGTLSASANNSGMLDTVTTLNSNPNSSQTWTLDAVGNQTAVNTDGTNKTNTLNSQNELTAFGAATLAFDNNGNTTTDDQGHTLVYDPWNKLVQVKNGGTTLAAYTYDATGNRIQQTDSGTTSDLYNSTAGQVLEERQSGTTTNQYVWSLAYVNTPVLRDDNSTSGSYGESGSGMGRRIYVQEDANENVTALTNTSGTAIQRFDYTPYGQMTALDATTSWGTTTNMYSWLYTFQGERYDATVGMSHCGAREYNATLQRWVQKDPACYIDGASMYQEESSNPIQFVDPTGMDAGWARYNPTPYDPYLYGPDDPKRAPGGPEVAGSTGSPIPGTPYRGVWEYTPDGNSHYHVVDGKGNRIGTENSDGSPHDNQTLDNSGVPKRYVDKIRDWAKEKAEKQQRTPQTPQQPQQPNEEDKSIEQKLLDLGIAAERARQQALDNASSNCQAFWDWLNNKVRNIHVPWPVPSFPGTQAPPQGSHK